MQQGEINDACSYERIMPQPIINARNAVHFIPEYYLKDGQTPPPQAGEGEQGAVPHGVSTLPELMACAEISFCRWLPPQWLQLTASLLLRTRVSKCAPQSSQQNS